MAPHTVALRPSDRQAAPSSATDDGFVAPATAQARPLRVLVADPCPATRVGLRTLLAEQAFVVCEEASDAVAAVEAAVREGPDVCLLEIKMAGDAVCAIEQIVELVPTTAVVVLTVAGDEEEALLALRAGAAAYVPKDADPETLALAIRAAARGEAVLPRSLVGRLIVAGDEAERRRRRSAELPLTSREQEVLELLRQGKSTAEIAAWLFVSQVTVRTHICSILKKLEVHDREAAIRLLADLPG